MNKSEELCRLLNIPKKYRGSRWEFIDRTYFVDSQIFDAEEDAKSYNNEEEFSVEELSVDLTKPSNFVKLFEHKIKVSNTKYTLSEFVYSNIDIIPKDINEFIDGVIEIIMGANYTIDGGKTWQREADFYIYNLNDTKKIIKSLQATKWDY